MKFLTLEQYLMGRGPVTPDLARNAEDLLRRMNVLLVYFFVDYPRDAGFDLSSGYRPPEINQATPGAAKNSQHMKCNAADVRDRDRRKFARWCLSRLDLLADRTIDLYMEHPGATDGANPWVHLQRVPPASGSRVFIPTADWAQRLAGKPLSHWMVRAS